VPTPDHECDVRVYLDGELVDDVWVEDLDPGRGYEYEDYAELLDGARRAAHAPDATAFDHALLSAVQDTKRIYRRHSYDSDWPS
jgi:hypothetical protein